ncbi:MAG: response regulator [Sandaracinaceae bacterium]|nr:response regulator [Sandaracinaceae bacterium]
MLTSVRVPEAFAPIFEKAQEYVKRYFSGVRFSPEHGTIGIADERYVLVRAGSLSVEFFDVVRGLYGDTRDEGVSVAREILFDLAHAMGLADARVFAEKMGVTEPIDRLSAGPIHFAYAGWAFVDIHPESAPAPGDDYVLYYDHPYSMEADGWIAAGRVADFPVCVMNAGYSSGWCESSFGIPLVASEITCRAKGDPHCRFIMAPPHRIEGRIREYLAAHPGVVPEPTAIEVPGFFRRKSTSEALSARTEQLSAQNAELERRVAERTAALLRANEALSRELVERRETEAALRESEELNHRILEAVPSGIVHVALSGAIQSANAEAQQILGLSYDALTQRYTSDFASVTIWESGEPAAPEDYPVTRALATGLAQPPVTFGVRRPDGKTSWAIFRAVPVRDPHSREVSGAIVTFVDITQRKADEELRRRLEEKVQRSQKLESLGLLAGGIAHDFNNLLVGILGNASWLASGKAQGTREWEATQRIVTAGRRAADLTKQMLAYSGRARLETVRVNLPEVVREMHELLHASIPQSVRVEFEPVADALWVEGDPAQLGQVIMNLLTNAYEATSAAKRGMASVRVSTTRVTLPAGALADMVEHERAQAGEFVCLTVMDDGIGMDHETMQHVFDPFFTTKELGHGLGLAAVLGIIRAHRGALDIASEPGRGTTFRVFIPEAPGPSNMSPPPRPDRPPAKLTGLFLVVDDEPVVRAVASAVLAQLGLTVIEARDGAEGIAIYRRHMGELQGVFLDLTMPVLDGFEVMREIRAKDPMLPIVLCSGYDRHEVIARLPQDPRCQFLAKPFTVHELEDAVRTLIGV